MHAQTLMVMQCGLNGEKFKNDPMVCADVHGPLRNSIFPGVPPFINYVPQAGFLGGGGLEPGSQYWDPDSGANKGDQEQLWRFTVAMQVRSFSIYESKK